MAESVVEKSYTIGDFKYLQKPLVLGQIEMLTNEIQGLPVSPELFSEGVSKEIENTEIGKSLLHLVKSGALTRCLAIVLIREGTTLKDRSLEEECEQLRWALSVEIGVQVVIDFFECNGSSKINSIVKDLSKKMAGNQTETLAE